MSVVRVDIRVKPNSARAKVGGTWGPDGHLVVAVQAPAVDGKANAAVIAALADAFGVPKRSVRIVRGETSRSKVVEITDPARLPVW